MFGFLSVYFVFRKLILQSVAKIEIIPITGRILEPVGGYWETCCTPKSVFLFVIGDGTPVSVRKYKAMFEQDRYCAEQARSAGNIRQSLYIVQRGVVCLSFMLVPKATLSAVFLLKIHLLVKTSCRQSLLLLSPVIQGSILKRCKLSTCIKLSCIDLFHNGDQINYSFVLMLISPTNLATTSKFQKNICFKTRAVGLFNINTKECKVGRHLWKWSIGCSEH